MQNCDKTVVTTVVRCSVCESVFHPSCALRLVGLVVVGRNNLVKCCIQSEVMPADNNELLSQKDQLIEIKNFLISELKEQDAILLENIILLKEKLCNISTELVNSGNTETTEM